PVAGAQEPDADRHPVAIRSLVPVKVALQRRSNAFALWWRLVGEPRGGVPRPDAICRYPLHPLSGPGLVCRHALAARLHAVLPIHAGARSWMGHAQMWWRKAAPC